MSTIENVTGLILAGGRGSRMGHVDKGLQRFRNSTMVAHVLRRLVPQVKRVVINANQNLDAYAVFGTPVWPDDLKGFEGPLAGLEAGLRRCTTDFLVTVPCDSPFFPTDLVARLHIALMEGHADLALAVTDAANDDGTVRIQPQPVFALMKTELLPVLSAYLELGGRRMDGWYKDIKVIAVRFDDASAFRNINTLGDLQKYEVQA